MKYQIQTEEYTYMYRSYMACEEHGEDDCVGRGFRYHVYKGKRKLKTHHSFYDAKEHIRVLNKRAKEPK